LADVRKEALVMLNVQHPNIVDFLGWGFVDGPQRVGAQMPTNGASLPADDDNDVMRPSAGYIVMDQPGDLWHMIEQRTKSEKGSPFPMAVAVDILLQIARAMLHMHYLGHMHRDLKASNCLVNLVDGIPYTCTVKLIDFGNSKKFNPKELAINTANSGTRTHMAPEVWAKVGTRSVPYTESADAYSFGMVCFEVISGLHPCDVDKVTKESFFGGRQTALSLPESTSCPDGLKELMSKCWFHNPNVDQTFKR
jgi:serine/threonine protein kinase